MTEQMRKFRSRLHDAIWDVDPRSLHGAQRFGVQAVRILHVVLRDFMSGQINLRAMSLVYTSLLSTVPLLAVSFSILKAFGVHNRVEPLLFDFLQPLGPKGSELAAKVIGFVENVDVGVLGAVGFGMLIYTVISLLQKIEVAFNQVWRVDSGRSFGQRFTNYLAVILVGPILVVGAIGITASVMNTALVQKMVAIEPFGSLIVGGSKLVPYVLVWIAFTFVYIFVPGTRVRIGAAATGGLIAGILWQTAGWGFTTFIASSARYAAIYSSFAIVILLLIWLYLNWLILILGAQIAFYAQNPRYLTMKPVLHDLSNRLKERLALGIMFLIGSHHYDNLPPWTLERLTDRFDLPSEPVGALLRLLHNEQFITRTGDDPPAYLPARDIGTLALRDLLAAVRGAEEHGFHLDPVVPGLEPVDAVVGRTDRAVYDALGTMTLHDLVLSREQPGAVNDDAGRTGRDAGPRTV